MGTRNLSSIPHECGHVGQGLHH